MLATHTAYKYETAYKGPFLITQCFNNGALHLQCGVIQIKYNTRPIQTYKLDTKVEDYNSISMYEAVNI